MAIPDFQLGEVVVIEPDGTWRGAWTRRGEGPGEVVAPVAAAWGADETLAVFDIGNARVVFLREGRPASSDLAIEPGFTAPIVAGGELVWAGVQPDGTALVRLPDRPAGSGGEGDRHAAAILRLSPGQVKPDTASRAAFPTVTGNGHTAWAVPGWPRPVAAVGGGRLALGATDGTYRIRVMGAGGASLLELCRETDPTPLSAAERGDSVPDGMDELAAAIRDAPRPPSPSPFGRIVLGARGRVWVQRERPPAFPGMESPLHGRPDAVHDVFEGDGTYLGEARLPEGVTLQAARGDTIWGFRTGRHGEVWVIAYRLQAIRTPAVGL